jgi:hypothetical protein
MPARTPASRCARPPRDAVHAAPHARNGRLPTRLGTARTARRDPHAHAPKSPHGLGLPHNALLPCGRRGSRGPRGVRQVRRGRVHGGRLLRARRRVQQRQRRRRVLRDPHQRRRPRPRPRRGQAEREGEGEEGEPVQGRAVQFLGKFLGLHRVFYGSLMGFLMVDARLLGGGGNGDR